MRVYFLHLTKSSLTATVDPSGTGTKYVAGPIDLYQNSSYSNWSTTKSNYGLNALGNFTWTGQTYQTPTVTDTGQILSGRYLDTSGQVNVVSWSINLATTPTNSSIIPTLSFYTSPDPSALFPTEWAALPGLGSSDPIRIENADRYVYISLDCQNDHNVTYSFDVFIRVEIDVPVMAPAYEESKTLFRKFPQWMAMRELGATGEVEDPSLVLATPQSVGGKLINDMAGEWLDDLNANLTYLYFQQFIDTADLNQAAWVYKTTNTPQFVFQVLTPTGTQLAQASDWGELLEALPTENVFWWDENNQIIYTNNLYTQLLINGIAYNQSQFQVWNSLDELGLRVSLSRINGESNASFAGRIRDVFGSGIGVGYDVFKKTLRREFNLWSLYGATPDSSYVGATPDVLEIEDIEQIPATPGATPYLTPAGMPTQRFVDLVNYLNSNYPITWGNFKWDEAIWDPAGEDYSGFDVLGNQLDATPVPLEDFQPGIGDGEDLLLYPPDAIVGAHYFTGQLVIRGQQKVTNPLFTPVRVDFQVYGQANRNFYNNPTTSEWMTVETTLVGDPNTYVASFQMSATSDADVNKPLGTSAGYSYFNLFRPDSLTSDSLSFFNKAQGNIYQKRLTNIPLSSVASMTLKAGQWNGTAYTNLPSGDVFTAWFNTNPGPILNFFTSSSWPSVSTTLATPNLSPATQVVLNSKQIAFGAGTWTSPPQSFTIFINNQAPYSTASPATFQLPTINWDPYITGGKTYIVKLTSQSNGIYGGFATNAPNDGSTILDLNSASVTFLDKSYIQLNGNNVWAVNQQGLPSTTTSVSFSVKSQGVYPMSVSTWQSFQANQIAPFTGIVDANGPWIRGVGRGPENTDFTLQIFNFKRSDFGLPDTNSYVITWIGVQNVSDPQVIAWLDTNTIKPAVSDGSNLTYPANSVVETLQGGHYIFSPVVVRARLRLNPAPQWNPLIHSGYFYENQNEYYLYANIATPELVSGASPILSGVPRQGAPVIVYTQDATPNYYEQVLFFSDASTPDPQHPVKLTMPNTETLYGSGTHTLYASYANIYGITVSDGLSNATYTPLSTSSTTNQINLSFNTDPSHPYVVTYLVKNSFWVGMDYDNPLSLGSQEAQIHFDAVPATPLNVAYEHSYLSPATPIDVPLNPFYTTINEGFIYISHQEYPLGAVLVYISPQKIVADGLDTMLVTIHALDTNGNPKPNQTFAIGSNFGTFDAATPTTNSDGFAVSTLTANTSLPIGGATPTINGLVSVFAQNPSPTFSSTTVPFEVVPASASPSYKMLATVAADQIPADGSSYNVVYGKIRDTNFNGVPNAFVRWRRARSIYELFAMNPQFALATPAFGGATPHTLYPPTAPPYPMQNTYGEVLTGVDGSFVIGPFLAATPGSPGYWFLAVDSSQATPSSSWSSVGDVVYWNEYAPQNYGVEKQSNVGARSIQMATPTSSMPDYSTHPAYPVYYSEANAPATPVTTTWLPASWYAINRYAQYQLGLLSDTPDKITDRSLTQGRPYRNDI